MNLQDIPESKNFQDDTAPSGLQYVKNVIGNYLYKHQYVRGANKQYYDPNQDAAYHASRNQPMPQLDAQGRRADIDWGSNSQIPGAAPLLSQLTQPTSPTATPNPAAQPSASSGGLLDRLMQAVRGH